MSRSKQKKIACPICATPFYKLLRPAVVGRGEVMIGLDYGSNEPIITHPDKVPLETMRCPLCYGKGWIRPELDVAFRIKFGGERHELKYVDLAALRQLMTNSVGANEMTDLVKCPICRGDKKIQAGIFYHDRPSVFVFPHGEYGKVKRCPLCYGKGSVEPALSSALMLIFGDVDRLEYRALTQLRLHVRNSVCANEIRGK